jgi:hypothetical protein
MPNDPNNTNTSTPAVDFSAGLVPKTDPSAGAVDFTAGLVPKPNSEEAFRARRAAGVGSILHSIQVQTRVRQALPELLLVSRTRLRAMPVV